jgi:hypothetical protein
VRVEHGFDVIGADRPTAAPEPDRDPIRFGVPLVIGEIRIAPRALEEDDRDEPAARDEPDEEEPPLELGHSGGAPAGHRAAV